MLMTRGAFLIFKLVMASRVGTSALISVYAVGSGKLVGEHYEQCLSL